jgi:hypothetical protein
VPRAGPLQPRGAVPTYEEMSDELRLRSRMIGAGLWLSAMLLGSVGVWIAGTWSRPHRGGLLAMVAAAAAVTLVIAVAP